MLAEHLHCRAEGCAALFDVSHMGQASLHGAGAAGDALEALVPGDIQGLKPGRQRYTVLTNEAGGIIDDLMVSRLAPDHLFLVVNASRAGIDLPHIERHLPAGVTMQRHTGPRVAGPAGPRRGRGDGPAGPGGRRLPVHGVRPRRRSAASTAWCPAPATPARTASRSRSPPIDVENLARLLLDQPEVQPAGLGARDSLRLEAGLCLYGNDIDELTTPIEADIAWVIGKRRRQRLGLPGRRSPSATSCRTAAPGVRVGIRPDGRAPARAGTTIVADDGDRRRHHHLRRLRPVAERAGRHGLRPPRPRRRLGTGCSSKVRGQPLPAHVAPMPFFPHRYVR